METQKSSDSQGWSGSTSPPSGDKQRSREHPNTKIHRWHTRTLGFRSSAPSRQLSVKTNDSSMLCRVTRGSWIRYTVSVFVVTPWLKRTTAALCFLFYAGCSSALTSFHFHWLTAGGASHQTTKPQSGKKHTKSQTFKRRREGSRFIFSLVSPPAEPVFCPRGRRLERITKPLISVINNYGCLWGARERRCGLMRT